MQSRRIALVDSIQIEHNNESYYYSGFGTIPLQNDRILLEAVVVQFVSLWANQERTFTKQAFWGTPGARWGAVAKAGGAVSKPASQP